MALRVWLKKHEVFDRDLVILFPKYNVNDPDKDLKNLSSKQWDAIKKRIITERANLLKDKKAKARLEKKFSTITKIWRKKRQHKDQKYLKKTLNKLAKDPLLKERHEEQQRWEQQRKKQHQREQEDTDRFMEYTKDIQYSNQNVSTEINQNPNIISENVPKTVDSDLKSNSNNISDYITININVKSLQYNAQTDSYSISLDGVTLMDNNPLQRTMQIQIEAKHINNEKDTNNTTLTARDIDTVLDEIEINESKLKFSNNTCVLHINDKLLIAGYIRNIHSETPKTLIQIITNYIHCGYMRNHILNIGIGGGGCRLLHEVYNNQYLEYTDSISDAHKYTQIASNAGTYFDVPDLDQIRARSIFIDLEEKVVDKIFRFDKQKDGISIYNSSDRCLGIASASDNWAKGHYTEGAGIIDQSMDTIRSHLEKTGIPQAIQVMHSCSGGTGSGLGTLVMLKCRDAFNTKVPIQTFSLFPSQSNNIQVKHWPYNVVMALHTMNELVDGVFALDYDKLFDICCTRLGINQPKSQDLNFVGYQAISDIISLYPKNGIMANDVLKYLSPRPSDQMLCDGNWEQYVYSSNMKYYTISHVPIYSQYSSYGSKHHDPYSMDTYKSNMIEISNVDEYGNNNQIMSKLFDKDYNFSSQYMDLKKGTNIATVIIHRGENLKEQEKEIIKTSERITRFVNCFHYHPLNLIINCAPKYTERNATMISNSTTIAQYFNRIHAVFKKLLSRRMFVQLYSWEGMDISEMEEASNTVLSIIASYERNH